MRYNTSSRRTPGSRRDTDAGPFTQRDPGVRRDDGEGAARKRKGRSACAPALPSLPHSATAEAEVAVVLVDADAGAQHVEAAVEVAALAHVEAAAPVDLLEPLDLREADAQILRFAAGQRAGADALVDPLRDLRFLLVDVAAEGRGVRRAGQAGEGRRCGGEGQDRLLHRLSPLLAPGIGAEEEMRPRRRRALSEVRVNCRELSRPTRYPLHPHAGPF